MLPIKKVLWGWLLLEFVSLWPHGAGINFTSVTTPAALQEILTSAYDNEELPSLAAVLIYDSAADSAKAERRRFKKLQTKLDYIDLVEIDVSAGDWNDFKKKHDLTKLPTILLFNDEALVKKSNAILDSTADMAKFIKTNLRAEFDVLQEEFQPEVIRKVVYYDDDDPFYDFHPEPYFTFGGPFDNYYDRGWPSYRNYWGRPSYHHAYYAGRPGFSISFGI